MERISWPRVAATTIAAHVTTFLVLGLLFGNPWVERVLFTDQAGQSPKVLSVFFEQEPLPAVTPAGEGALDVTTRRLTMQGLLFLWSLSLVLAFATTLALRPGRPWLKGVGFGVAAWGVTFLFLEAWVPYNMLGEPIGLVGLELGLQLVAMIVTGIVIAVTYQTPPAVAGGDREDVVAAG